MLPGRGRQTATSSSSSYGRGWERRCPTIVRKPNGEPTLRHRVGVRGAVDSPRQPRPEVFVYRRTEEAEDRAATIPTWADERAQLQGVKAFFAQFRNADGSLKGGINEYATPSEFKTLLSQHLQSMSVWRRLPPSRDDGEAPPVVATIPLRIPSIG